MPNTDRLFLALRSTCRSLGSSRDLTAAIDLVLSQPVVYTVVVCYYRQKKPKRAPLNLIADLGVLEIIARGPLHKILRLTINHE